ncbi:hypothetical protein C8J56DRAFT_960183 [Mycena floridula]|nr:hypothetical protein C8J56DRAFT_960183 [Mycena floridula]
MGSNKPFDLDDELNRSNVWDVEHFLAHLNEDDEADDGRHPVNHWLFFIQIVTQDRSEKSLSFSMTSGESSKYGGTIVLANKDYPSTNKGARTISAHFISRVTVGEIIQFMMVNKLDQYHFTDDHEGCDYWCYVVVKRFAEQGWIPTETCQDLEVAIRFYYPDSRHGRRTPISKDSFDGLVQGRFSPPS